MERRPDKVAWQGATVSVLLNIVGMGLELVVVRSTVPGVPLWPMAIRDMANSPLQALELDAASLSRMPGLAGYGRRILRSLERLRDWQHQLQLEEEHLPWTPELESFDARDVLRRRDEKPPSR